MKIDGRISIASAGVLYGGLTVDASLLAKGGLSTLDISFFFLVISIIPLAPFVLKRNILQKMLTSSKFLGTYALVNTFILLSQFGSLSLGLAPAVVALLLYTQPMWTVIFGKALFKEKIDRVRIAVIVIALLGIVLVTDPFSALPQSSGGSTTLVAELLAVFGGVFLSLWIILGRKGRLDNFKDPVELTFAVRSATCIPIGAISFCALLFGKGLFLGNLHAIYSNLWLLVVFSIFAGTAPDFLFYLGVEKVQSLQAGVILLLEPISSAVISAVLMLSSLTVLQILGGALILVSNYLVIRDSRLSTQNPPANTRI